MKYDSSTNRGLFCRFSSPSVMHQAFRFFFGPLIPARKATINLPKSTVAAISDGGVAGSDGTSVELKWPVCHTPLLLCLRTKMTALLQQERGPKIAASQVKRIG